MNIDQALSRGSQLSQIALVFLAVFGYFYTVVPVYQKDLLSEQISEKELQLSQLEKELANYPEKVSDLKSQVTDLQSDVEQLEMSKDLAASELAQIKSKRAELESTLMAAQAKKYSAESKLNETYRRIYFEAFSFSALIEYSMRDKNIHEIIDGSPSKKELSDYFLTPYDAINNVISNGGSKSMDALDVIPHLIRDKIHKEIQQKLTEHKYSLSSPLVDLESEFYKFEQRMKEAEVDATPGDGFNETQFQIKLDFANFVSESEKREMKRVSEFMDQF